MRRTILWVMLAVPASLLPTGPSWSGQSDFDIKGVWAAESKGCSDAQAFVEFDGRDMLGYSAGAAKARIAEGYSAVVEGGRLTLNMTDLKSRSSEELRFLIDGKDAIRLDSEFLARKAAGGAGGAVELFKLTRCSTPT